MPSSIVPAFSFRKNNRCNIRQTHSLTSDCLSWERWRVCIQDENNFLQYLLSWVTSYAVTKGVLFRNHKKLVCIVYQWWRITYENVMKNRQLIYNTKAEPHPDIIFKSVSGLSSLRAVSRGLNYLQKHPRHHLNLGSEIEMGEGKLQRSLVLGPYNLFSKLEKSRGFLGCWGRSCY